MNKHKKGAARRVYAWYPEQIGSIGDVGDAVGVGYVGGAVFTGGRK